MSRPLLSRLGSHADERSTIAAIERSQAVIEFKLDGTILRANDNFLAAVGYDRAEVEGQHHRMFVEPAYAKSPEYTSFWQSLGQGTYVSGEFRRLGKGGREIWLQASYNPVFDRAGRPVKVIKFASDITAQKVQAADHAGQVAAIGRALAVIEFALDGTILTANENFLAVTGYSLDEVKGRHHRMFVDPAYAASPDYAAFWTSLAAGDYVSAEFRRFGKGGKEIWIQACYNPVFDTQGRPVKVVKFATDITERKRAEGVMRQLNSSLGKMAEGDLTGRIDTVFTGEYDELRQAFNASLERMTEIVCQLKRTSGELKSATGEILMGANDLSERTTRQAAAIEETSASMEQLLRTVTDNAARADAASSQAQSVSRSADEGGAVMRQANEAMEQISVSSGKISNIIGLIDDIAFQTNLLALNASVEAARAGEAGKGFAVVAVEVRRLAQSAAQASAEVKVLIEQSASEVGTGSRLVAEAAAKLTGMLSSVRDNAGIIGEIADASRSQAKAIQVITASVHQMDEMTQHNAALVEETNAAIEQTEAEASALDGIVARFTVGRVVALEAPQRAAPRLVAAR